MRHLLLIFSVGCGAENILALGRDPQACEANLPPQCSAAPRCILDASHYLTGKFPGSASFIVHTDGAAKLTFQLLLENAKASGTDLELIVQESNCSETYTFDNMGRDVVREANSDGVLQIPLTVTRGGDHPVQLVSDAYLDWTLIVDVPNQMPSTE